MNFIITGNGFDLYHSMKTSYLHFRNYMECNYPKELEQIEKLLINPTGKSLEKSIELWTDLENTLRINDNKTAFDHYAHRETLDYELKIRNLLVARMGEWAKTVDVHKPEPKLPVTNDDFYLSFNYTKTLEDAYGIRAERVNHIHLKNGVTKVGHPNTNTDLIPQGEAMRRVIEAKCENERKICEKELDDILTANQIPTILDKNPESLLNSEESPFNKIIDCNTVLIMGWAIGDCDLGYWQWLVHGCQESNKKIVFYWYKEEDKKRYEKLSNDASFYNYEFKTWPDYSFAYLYN